MNYKCCNGSPQKIPFQFSNGKLPHSRSRGLWALSQCALCEFIVSLASFSGPKGVPDRPRLRLLSTDSTSAKLELKVRANSKQPPLWCSIFHRPKFGQPKETLLPARNLNSIHITPLRCGTSYRSVFCTHTLEYLIEVGYGITILSGHLLSKE